MACELAGEQPLCFQSKRDTVFVLKSFAGLFSCPEVVLFSELVFVGFVLKSLERTKMSAEKVALAFDL